MKLRRTPRLHSLLLLRQLRQSGVASSHLRCRSLHVKQLLKLSMLGGSLESSIGSPSSYSPAFGGCGVRGIHINLLQRCAHLGHCAFCTVSRGGRQLSPSGFQGFGLSNTVAAAESVRPLRLLSMMLSRRRSCAEFAAWYDNTWRGLVCRQGFVTGLQRDAKSGQKRRPRAGKGRTECEAPPGVLASLRMCVCVYSCSSFFSFCLFFFCPFWRRVFFFFLAPRARGRATYGSDYWIWEILDSDLIIMKSCPLPAANIVRSRGSELSKVRTKGNTPGRRGVATERAGGAVRVL